MEKSEIPPRGRFANRFNLRTLGVGEYYEVLEKPYTLKWARAVGTTLRYYESDQPGKKFVQRKWKHATIEGKFIIRIYRKS